MTGETAHKLRGDYSRMRPDYTVDQDWSAYPPEAHALWRRLYERQAGLVAKYAAPEFRATLASLPLPPHMLEAKCLAARLVPRTRRAVGRPTASPTAASM